MGDEVVGHMTERVTIPPAGEVQTVDRKRPSAPPNDGWLPYAAGKDLIPAMAHAGEGYNIHVTGLTHDERGYPTNDAQIHDRLVRRLSRKVQANSQQICEFEKLYTGEAETGGIAY